MSAAPALLLFERHSAWAGVLWCYSGPAPVPVSGEKSMSITCNVKKETQNSKVPAYLQIDPSTLQWVGDTREQH